MYINQIQSTYNFYSNQKCNLSFKGNVNSSLLKFHNEDFFVNIKGYGKNKDWVVTVKKIADNAVLDIKSGKTADKILSKIAKGVKIANGFCRDLEKRKHTGILRTERKGYGKTGNWKGIMLVTPIIKKYECYEEKLDTLVDNPLKNPFFDIKVAEVERCNFSDYDLRVVHPDDKLVNNALDRVSCKYFKLNKDFISNPKNIKKENLPKINSDIAEIRWIMAHSMPWERGSDSISNVFMRSLYKSMGIKTYPLKQDISLDFEAFCTPLNDYKSNFDTYFEKAPEIVG